MKVKSKSEVAQSCPTLSDLMDCSLPGSSIHGILQSRVLEGGAIALVLAFQAVFDNHRPQAGFPSHSVQNSLVILPTVTCS